MGMRSAQLGSGSMSLRKLTKATIASSEERKKNGDEEGARALMLHLNKTLSEYRSARNASAAMLLIGSTLSASKVMENLKSEGPADAAFVLFCAATVSLAVVVLIKETRHAAAELLRRPD